MAHGVLARDDADGVERHALERGAVARAVATALHERPQLLASASGRDEEVDAILLVPVAELLLDEVYREELWTWSASPPWVDGDGAAERSIFFFELVGDTVWGATAAMLRQLLGVALGLPTGIDHR